MFVVKYVTVLSGKYPANFTRIPDSTGCLHFTGYRIVLSGSGTSLISMPENLDFHCASGSKHAKVHAVLQKYFVETKARVYYL